MRAARPRSRSEPQVTVRAGDAGAEVLLVETRAIPDR